MRCLHRLVAAVDGFLNTLFVPMGIDLLVIIGTGSYRRTGPVSLGVGGGGWAAEVSCPNIFSVTCQKIKWFCPNITCLLPESGHLKILALRLLSIWAGCCYREVTIKAELILHSCLTLIAS